MYVQITAKEEKAMKKRILAILFAISLLLGAMPIYITAGDEDISLEGYSVGLNDCICLRYHFSMSEEAYAGDGYVRFSMQNGREKTVPLSEGELNGESGYYVYSFEVAAPEMTEKISCSVYGGNGQVIRTFDDYSVKQYADVILNGNEEYTEETVELVKAMLNYGAYAQIYFNKTESGLANEGIDDNVAEADVSIFPTFQKSGEFFGLKYVSTALDLQSKVVMYHYFTFDESVNIDKLVFWFGGSNVTPTLDEKNGVKRYCFKSNGISPEDILKGTGFMISDPSSGKYGSLTVSASCYLSAVISNVNDDPDLVLLSKAIFIYALAASDFSSN